MCRFRSQGDIELMEANDERYSKLQNRIQEIINNFAFKNDSSEVPTAPTPQQQDFIRAMIVLCHAEFEDYLEEIAYNLLKIGIEKWNSSKIANKNLAALFLDYDKIPTSQAKDITTKIYKVISDYKNDIKSNHGIKRHNINNLFNPLGYKEEDFDQTFINELNSFGANRGEFAHNSCAKVTTILDYNDEKNKIERILKEIKDFEDSLERVNSFL